MAKLIILTIKKQPIKILSIIVFIKLNWLKFDFKENEFEQCKR